MRKPQARAGDPKAAMTASILPALNRLRYMVKIWPVVRLEKERARCPLAALLADVARSWRLHARVGVDVQRNRHPAILVHTGAAAIAEAQSVRSHRRVKQNPPLHRLCRTDVAKQPHPIFQSIPVF